MDNGLAMDQSQLDTFLENTSFAVVGASEDRAKYGNKVLRCYQQHELAVYPVNPRSSEIEGAKCFASLSAIPDKIGAVSIITPPQITEKVVEEAAELGIKHLWLQPGAESDTVIKRGKELGLSLIAGGPCLLVVLGFKEED